MEAAEILRRLSAAAVRLDRRGDRLSAWPAPNLTDELRELIRTHKPALVAYLTEAHQTAAELIDAAMRACDHWQDGPEARQAMRQQIEQTPLHLHRDLTDHFKQSYGGQAND